MKKNNSIFILIVKVVPVLLKFLKLALVTWCFYIEHHIFPEKKRKRSNVLLTRNMAQLSQLFSNFVLNIKLLPLSKHTA